MQVVIAHSVQFLLQNPPNGRQIFGRFGFYKTESKQISGFLHTPSGYCGEMGGRIELPLGTRVGLCQSHVIHTVVYYQCSVVGH